MKVLALLRSLSLSQIRLEPIRSGLTLLGVALGVGIFTSIQLATESAFESFASSSALLSANAPLSVTAASGEVPEQLVPTLRSLAGIQTLLPYSSRFLEVFDGPRSLGFYQIVGIDLFSDSLASYIPDRQTLPRGEFLKLLGEEFAVFAPEELAHVNALTIAPEGAPIPIPTVFVLPAQGIGSAFGGKVLLFDISQFQRLFHSPGVIDRLDLILDSKLNVDEIRSVIERSLPSGISVSQPSDTREQSERVTAAFRLNLRFLGSIALFAAALLVYNTVSFSVLLRRRDFGIVLALGGTSRDIGILIVLEMLVLGVIGAALGVVFGWAFSLSSLQLVSQSLSTLYLPVRATTVALSFDTLLPCFFLGPFVSVTAALVPAYEAATLPLREQLANKGEHRTSSRAVRSVTVGGILLLALAYPVSRPEFLAQNIALGFLSSIAVVFGVVLFVPVIFVALKRVSVMLPFSYQLALDHIVMTLRRNSISAAAMIVSLGMFLGVTTMISGFRESVTDWITHVTRADIFISAQGVNISEPSATLPGSLLDSVRTLPGVQDYDLLLSRKVQIDGRPVRVNGVRFETIVRYDRLPFLEGQSKTARDLQLARGDCVLVSEAFAHRSGIRRGATVRIPGLAETREFPVCDIYYDYASDQGVVFIPQERFTDLFGPANPQGVSLYLAPGTNPAPTLERLRKMFSGMNFQIRDNKTIRNEVLTVFDDTFKVTHALQWIALFVSALVVLNTISMLILDRSREFGVLRAIGARSSQIRGMIAAEAITIGALSAILGALLGVLLEILLVFVINKHFFGWSVTLALPLGLYLSTIAGTIALSWIAGSLPGSRFAKRLDAHELRYE